jgi:hypothetical protein
MVEQGTNAGFKVSVGVNLFPTVKHILSSHQNFQVLIYHVWRVLPTQK